MCLAASAGGLVGAWNGGWVGEEQAGPEMRQRERRSSNNADADADAGGA